MLCLIFKIDLWISFIHKVLNNDYEPVISKKILNHLGRLTKSTFSAIIYLSK